MPHHFMTMFSCFASLLIAISGANAAVLSPETGTTRINTGSGYVSTNKSTNVAPGTQVIVEPGGVAVLKYAENCTVRLHAGRVWTVVDGVPCRPGQRSVDFSGRMGQQVPAGTYPGPYHGPQSVRNERSNLGRRSRPQPDVGHAAGHVSRGAIIAGGVVVGGVVVAIVAARRNKSSSP